MEKINLVELLKDCPEGMELYCIMFEGSVVFEDISEDNEYPIGISTKSGEYTNLTKYGQYLDLEEAKCVIFPKGKTTWEGFQRPFKDGDILSYQCSGLKNRSIYIYKYHPRMNTSYYVALGGNLNFMINSNGKDALNGYNTTARLATKEEKARLFQVIKENGYKWNPETKTLENLIISKFKIGDKIKKTKDSINGIVSAVFNDSFKVTYFGGGYNYVQFRYQDDWELAPIPKFKVGDIIKDKCNLKWKVIDVNNHYYEVSLILTDTFKLLEIKAQDDYELVPNKFNIKTLKPFESKVLVRDKNTEKWKSTFWGFYDIDNAMNYPYECCGNSFAQCVPYEGNEHLLGTTNDCDEYFKNWKL